jgi:phosphatidylglycerol:prolipoprotein diacylglycerol transferase
VYPHLVIGSVALNSYGIALVVGFACAWRVLRMNLSRHGLDSGIADKVILVLLVTGLLGAKLFHDFESASRLLAYPWGLVSLSGFAWSGGLLAGIASLFLLARRLSLSPLLLMDLAAPSASLGYALGRLGCLLAGDGDYGVPTSFPWGMSFPHGLVPTYQRVHPTPIYEAIVAVLIFCCLWRASRDQRPAGSIMARYLALSGTSRFLVEFIRINPRSFFGLTDAQLLSAVCIIAAMVFLLRPKRFFAVKPISQLFAQIQQRRGES